MLNRVCPIFASLALLGGMAAQRASFAPPKSAVEYHRRVQVAAGLLPLNFTAPLPSAGVTISKETLLRFGEWNGEDIPVPPDARRMLHPNVLVSRKYKNKPTGLEIGFLLVQCDDARAIMDHYPPICYVTQGFNKDSAAATDWNVGPLTSADLARITGTEYEFTRQSFGQTVSIVVDNFIVMPDGQIMRDMEAAKSASSDPTRRFFGAAQFQIVFSRGISREEREAVFETFAGISAPVIEAVRSGQKH